MEKAQEEVIADACEMMLKDSKAIEALARKDKSLAQKIVDWLKDFAEKLRAAFKGIDPYTDAGKIVYEMQDSLADIQKLWDDALVSAVENYKAAEIDSRESTEVKYSARTDNIADTFGIVEPKKYVHVQKQVISTLKREGFFTNEDGSSRTVINDQTGLEIVINRRGIAETFNEANYARRSKRIREIKLATIRLLPDIIANGTLVADNIENYHKDNSSIKYAYIESDVNVDGTVSKILIAIRKSPQKNLFWVHHIDIKKDTTGLAAGTSKSSKTAYKTVDAESIIYDSSDIVKDSAEITEDPDALYSDRMESDYLTERDILSEKFAEMAETEEEKQLIETYRENAAHLNEISKKLDKVQKQFIEAWYVKKGEKRDMKKVEALSKKREKLRAQLDAADRTLLEIRAAKPIKTIIIRAQAKYKKQNKKDLSELRKSIRDNSDAVKYRERIIKNVKELNKWILNPTDKKHVPLELQGAVADLLSSLDMTKPITPKYLNRVKNVRIKGEDGEWYSRPRREDELTAREKENAKWEETVDSLRKLSSTIAVMEGKASAATVSDEYTGDSFMIDADAEISKRIDEFLEGVKTVNVNTLDVSHLKKLDELIRSVKHTITQQNKAIIEGREKSIGEIGNVFITDMEAQKRYLPSSKDTINNARKYFNFEMQNAYYYGDIIGSSMKGVMNTLGRGMSRMYLRINEIEKFVESLPSEYEGENISFESITKKESKTFHLKYGTLTLTKPQIMSLYLLSKRIQADKHLKGFGVVVNTEELLKLLRETKKNKGKDARLTNKDIRDIMDHTRQVQLEQEDIDLILASLSNGEMFLADKLQKFVSHDCAEWGNEVSMALFGYKKFTEDDYWTIESDKSFLETSNVEDKNSGLYAIQNMGMTKGLVKNANNTIVLRSAFDVFFDHSLDMAKYSTMRIPIGDALKFLNYNEKGINESGGNDAKSVKGVMERAFGAEAETYFKNLIKDINGVGGDNRGNAFFTKAMSNAKASAVAYNFRVAVQQPMSIVKATYYMDPKYLFAKNTGGFKEAEKYSGLAYAKKLGLYDVNISAPIKKQLMGTETKLEKFTEYGMLLPGKMDELTWGWLWNACKAEVAELQKDISPGSDAYFTEVTRRFEEIINLTQVIDTPMNKAQIMRSKDGIQKQYTSFMSEPIMTLQLMLKSIREATVEARSVEGNWIQKGKKIALKPIAKFLTIHAATSALLALAQSTVDASRDDDEYQNWLKKWLKAYPENLAQNLSIIGMIPYVKDIVAILRGGNTNDLSHQSISYLTKAVKGGIKLYEKVDHNEDVAMSDLWEMFENSAKSVSYLSGVPASNILRALESTANSIPPLFGVSFSLNTWGDASIYAAFSAGRISDAKAAADELVEIKLKKIREEDSKLTTMEAKRKAQSSVRSSLTPKFKEEYLRLRYDDKSTTDLKSDILDLYLGYTSETFKDWEAWARKTMAKYGTYEEYEKSK